MAPAAEFVRYFCTGDRSAAARLEVVGVVVSGNYVSYVSVVLKVLKHRK